MQNFQEFIQIIDHCLPITSLIWKWTSPWQTWWSKRTPSHHTSFNSSWDLWSQHDPKIKTNENTKNTASACKWRHWNRKITGSSKCQPSHKKWKMWIFWNKGVHYKRTFLYVHIHSNLKSVCEINWHEVSKNEDHMVWYLNSIWQQRRKVFLQIVTDHSI